MADRRKQRFMIGDAAKNQVTRNPTNSVFGSNDKPMMSVTYKDEIKMSSAMKVSHVWDKSSDTSNTMITITNDMRERVTMETETNRMTKDAEIFKPGDDKYKVKAKAKGILEGYVYEMKNAMTDEKIRSKLEPAFKKKIEKAIGHLNGWLKYVQNPHANENEIKNNLKRNKQDYYDPIIAKIKQLK